MNSSDSHRNDKPPLEILQLSFKSRRLALFENRTEEPVDIGLLVVVSVDRGEDMGRVVSKTEKLEASPELVEGFFLRLPLEEDLQRYNENVEFEKEVLEHCKMRVKARNLEMRLTDCETQLDRNRIRIFFTADQRTDFRGLVRDLASAFRARIEMRQSGVRDDAKHKDGVGICGRRLCCAGFLDDFKSVTLKSVRDQDLSPNPSKISGSCSRLMCCLEYETDLYRRAMKTFPRVGAKHRLAGRQCTVKNCNIFLDQVTVLFDDAKEEVIEIEEFHRMRTMPAEEIPAPEPPGEEPEAVTGEVQETDSQDEAEKPEIRQSKGRRRHRKNKNRKEERKS